MMSTSAALVNMAVSNLLHYVIAACLRVALSFMKTFVGLEKGMLLAVLAISKSLLFSVGRSADRGRVD